MNVKFKEVDLDNMPDGDKMYGVFKEMSGQVTLPCIYVNNEKIGNCHDLYEVIKSKDLE